MLYSLIMAIAMGIVVAGGARMLVSGGGGGIPITMVIGVVGAVAGRFVCSAIFGPSFVLGMVFAVLGATGALAVFRALSDD